MAVPSSPAPLSAPPLSVAEALAAILAGVTPHAAEQVPVEAAHGRTLAADLAARLTQPPFDASAMDGYAVRSRDVASLPARLRVIGEAAAGHPFTGAIAAGEAVRIFTGAPVPAGADAIRRLCQRAKWRRRRVETGRGRWRRARRLCAPAG